MNHSQDSKNAEPEDPSNWCGRWAPAARLFAIRYAGWVDGEDLAQEALALLLSAIREGKIPDERAAGGFVLATCRTLVMAHGRKRRRREALLERGAPLMEKVAQPLSIDRQRLWSCLNQLAARTREVVLRSYVHEETAPEIAASLALSETNVRAIRHRALTTLYGCMHEGGAR